MHLLKQVISKALNLQQRTKEQKRTNEEEKRKEKEREDIPDVASYKPVISDIAVVFPA